MPATTFLLLNIFLSSTLSWEGRHSVLNSATKCWRGFKIVASHSSSLWFSTTTRQRHWISWVGTPSLLSFWRNAWDTARKTTSTKTLGMPTSRFQYTRRQSTTTKRHWNWTTIMTRLTTTWQSAYTPSKTTTMPSCRSTRRSRSTLQTSTITN